MRHYTLHLMSREQGSLNDGTVDVVLIGHSKTFVSYNEKTLEPFLKWVAMA